MGILRKIVSSSEFLPVTFVLILGILAGRILLTPGYFNMHDDLQMMRQLEMEKCFLDFQIPCRWVPDMGYGFGFPLFNYYPPLPYLIGEGIRLFGATFVITAKLTFFLSFVVSGITMYLLARQFWGRLGGIVSSAFYIWAPYHSVDIFVRGAMNEAWALAWFPLILWVAYKLITAGEKYKFRWIVALALSWFALLTSHNLMVLIFAPLFSLWCVVWLSVNKAWIRIPQLALSGIWAFGLAAFFNLPVVVEQKLVQIDTLTKGYYEYVAHFATIDQLFLSRFWGYGASVWGTGDRMAFPIGYAHWGITFVIMILILLSFLFRKKINSSLLLVVSLFIMSGLFASFMAHAQSTPIWLQFPALAIVQFPWRFLTLVILCFSFVAGITVFLINEFTSLFARVVFIVLVVGVVYLNKDFFQPEKMGPLTDREKFSAAAWELQQTAGIYDYLPRDARIAPQGPRTSPMDVIEGKANYTDLKEGTNWMKVKINVESDNSVIRINTFNFPNWKAFIDGRETEIKPNKDDELARIHINVPGGEHKIEIRLFNTPVRTISNTISFVSWVVLAILIWKKRSHLGRIKV